MVSLVESQEEMDWFKNFHRKYCLKQFHTQLPPFHAPPRGIHFQLSGGDVAPTLCLFRYSLCFAHEWFLHHLLQTSLSFTSESVSELEGCVVDRRNGLPPKFLHHHPFFTLRVSSRSISQGHSLPLQWNIHNH